MANDFRGAESGHWYASPRTVEMGVARYPGEPVTEVPGAGGKYVRPGPNHALKFGLAKGTTSVLKRLAKPTLTSWMARTAAKAAVTKVFDADMGVNVSPAERFLSGSIDERKYTEECLLLQEQIAKGAADAGSVIHAHIERGFLGQPFVDDGVPGEVYFQTTLIALHAAFGASAGTWTPEKPFYHPLGFGGRTDILRNGGENLVVVDFKTRDFDAADVEYAHKAKAKGQKTLGKLTPYETEPMQIAANLHGHGGETKASVRGANLYLSRTDPSLVFVYEYSAEELEKAWACFTALLTLDQIQSGIYGR